ncbi:MAG: multidrug efflux SMR transporter [Chloroflexota bacterium]|nr:multidrug efflux SMR transporter [Chloroflexota bacterium]
MAWVYLITAGLLEIAFAFGLKYSQGFTRLWPTLGFLLGGGASFYLLTRALQSLPVGTAYAIWTGIGAAGTALVGMLVLGEPRGALRIGSLILIVAGVVGLRLAEGR